jgi:peptide-methionine (S)-S-oxide reductase
MAIATFAAGCFWGVEAVFQQITGVNATQVGYTGGDMPDPSYTDICTGKTGHAEAVRMDYNSEQVSYRELLERFFTIHDPTTKNRQGPDVGTQYRSAIFYHTPEQEEIARTVMHEVEESGRYNSKIVTEIVPAGPFYPAEDYHQSYFLKMGRRYGGLV